MKNTSDLQIRNGLIALATCLAIHPATLHAAGLTASDGALNDIFGNSVSLSGSIGLVGAESDDIGANANQGSAYVFRSLNTATGMITENVKLTASDGAASDGFGFSVGLSGSIGLVGANFDDIGANSNQGSAYVFRNLDTATGSITENVKLTASDGAASDIFGNSVSQSGSIGLVGANGDDIGANSNQGSAYVFRSLDTATGSITENVKLTASDGAASDGFGISVSQSGSIGLVGASGDDIGANVNQGSAYVFRSLDTATGMITENVKLTASDGAASDLFGRSVGLDGDQFIIGANAKNFGTGKAYTGSVASVTTLDTGSTSKTISGISFITQDNWIIGQTTDANIVTLSAGDTANVTASGKAVYIGQNAGSDNNTLIVNGNVTANELYIGVLAGNEGNTLSLDSTGTFAINSIRLAQENFLEIEGDYTNITSLLVYLGTSNLQVWTGSLWETVDSVDYSVLITSSFSSGITTIQAIPEPSTCVLIGLGAAVILFRRRKA